MTVTRRARPLPHQRQVKTRRRLRELPPGAVEDRARAPRPQKERSPDGHLGAGPRLPRRESWLVTKAQGDVLSF